MEGAGCGEWSQMGGRVVSGRRCAVGPAIAHLLLVSGTRYRYIDIANDSHRTRSVHGSVARVEGVTSEGTTCQSRWGPQTTPGRAGEVSGRLVGGRWEVGGRLVGG